MDEEEKELIRIIRNSNDPAKAMIAAVDIIVNFLIDLKSKEASHCQKRENVLK